MRGFLRKVAGLLDYETPYAEPHRDDLAIIPGLDNPQEELAIAELDRLIFKRHVAGYWGDRDRLLDKRNAIRPPRPAQVPVIPGRSS